MAAAMAWCGATNPEDGFRRPLDTHVFRDESRAMADAVLALADAWPIFGLRVITPSVELRLPTDEELLELELWLDDELDDDELLLLLTPIEHEEAVPPKLHVPSGHCVG